MHGPPTYATLHSWQGPWKTSDPNNLPLPAIEAGTWGVEEPGNGSCRDHKDLLRGTKIPWAEPLAPEQSHSRTSCPIRLVVRRSQRLYANASGQLILSDMAPVASPRNPGDTIYPAHQIDPFIVAQHNAQNTQRFCDYLWKRINSLIQGHSSWIGPAISHEEIVVKFLFWLEFSKGLKCSLCRELELEFSVSLSGDSTRCHQSHRHFSLLKKMATNGQ